MFGVQNPFQKVNIAYYAVQGPKNSFAPERWATRPRQCNISEQNEIPASNRSSRIRLEAGSLCSNLREPCVKMHAGLEICEELD